VSDLSIDATIDNIAKSRTPLGPLVPQQPRNLAKVLISSQYYGLKDARDTVYAPLGMAWVGELQEILTLSLHLTTDVCCACRDGSLKTPFNF
jgi:hypothetical protein